VAETISQVRRLVGYSLTPVVAALAFVKIVSAVVLQVLSDVSQQMVLVD
jgi:type II secretory pathway component PulJ